MINYSKIYFFLTVLIVSKFSFARMHEYESSRFKSTGGTGAGSILLEESAFLNPASVAFFPVSSIYFQKDSSQVSDNLNTNYPKNNNLGFVLADGNQGLSGTLSYINQSEDNINRKRWGLSIASPMSEVSSFGVSVRSTTDQYELLEKSEKYYQTVFGISHSLGEDTSVGIVLYDPFKSIAHQTKILIGAQKLVMSYITLGLDIGANYSSKNPKSTALIRGSVQVKVLDDFFIRFGAFNDKETKEDGEGYGLAWIQPKLAFEFSFKNLRNQILARSQNTNKETSFSISLRGF